MPPPPQGELLVPHELAAPEAGDGEVDGQIDGEAGALEVAPHGIGDIGIVLDEQQPHRIRPRGSRRAVPCRCEDEFRGLRKACGGSPPAQPCRHPGAVPAVFGASLAPPAAVPRPGTPLRPALPLLRRGLRSHALGRGGAAVALGLRGVRRARGPAAARLRSAAAGAGECGAHRPRHAARDPRGRHHRHARTRARGPSGLDPRPVLRTSPRRPAVHARRMDTGHDTLRPLRRAPRRHLPRPAAFARSGERGGGDPRHAPAAVPLGPALRRGTRGLRFRRLRRRLRRPAASRPARLPCRSGSTLVRAPAASRPACGAVLRCRARSAGVPGSGRTPQGRGARASRQPRENSHRAGRWRQ